MASRRVPRLDQQSGVQAELIEDQFLPGRGILGPLGHGRQPLALFATRPFLTGLARRRRFVQSALGMHVTDEAHVARQVPQHALPAVGTVATDHDLPIRKPRRHQANQLQGQLGAGAVTRRPAGFLGFVVRRAFLLALGETLAIAIQPDGKRQGPHLGGRPERTANQQADHHPVVAPAYQLQRSTGDKRVVVHTGAVDGQTALAAQRIVYGQLDDSRRYQGDDQQQRQHLTQVVEPPGRLAEEAMIAAVVSVMRRTARLDQLGDVAVSERQAPTRH